MKKRFGLILMVALVAVLAFSTAQAAGPGKATIRYHLGYMMSSGSTQFTHNNPYDYTLYATDSKFEGSPGAGISFEYRYSDLIGLETGLSFFRPKLRVQIQERVPLKALAHPNVDMKQGVKVVPVTLGLNFHLTPAKKADFYAGVFAAYVNFGSFSQTYIPNRLEKVLREGRGEIDFKNQFTFGIRTGVDIPINSNWSFSARLEYMDLKAKVDSSYFPSAFPSIGKAADSSTYTSLFDGQELKMRPVMITVGASFHF